MAKSRFMRILTRNTRLTRFMGLGSGLLRRTRIALALLRYEDRRAHLALKMLALTGILWTVFLITQWLLR